ncbi:MAG: AAA family ATPase [Deltaproteobacteria bacterium]|nr:AAA family ATPase [Deltaproteobacteria bacterium]
MYLDRIVIERFKLMEHLEIDLCGGEGLRPRKFTVIIGPNGCGKSSVLQAIAMTAVGAAEINNLANEVREHVVDRRNEESMCLSAIWRVGGDRLRSEVELASNSYSYSARAISWTPGGPIGEEPQPDPLVAARGSAEQGAGRDWLVAAYGVHRFVTAGRPEAPRQPSVDRLRSVFSPTTTLVGPHFLERVGPERSQEMAALFRTVMRKIEPHLPGMVDLELRGQGGIQFPADLISRARFRQTVRAPGQQEALSLPLPALAHGLQSIVAWVTDLVGSFGADPGLGWAERPRRGGPRARDAWAEATLAGFRGTVLIDEIDLHLHPMWQRGIVPALRAAFPALQFIVTTHSPVVLAQVAPEEIIRLDIDDETGNICEVAFDEESGELEPRSRLGSRAWVPDPRQQTVGELMQAMFRLDTPYANPMGGDLRRYLALRSAETTPPARSAASTATGRRRNANRLDSLRDSLAAAGVVVDRDAIERVPP